jgi:flagellar L-ring protein precursor FlgH
MLISLSISSLFLPGCASQPESIVKSPYTAQPAQPPAYIERINTGSIYQPGAQQVSMFSGEHKPRSVGDTLKVDISEALSTSSKLSTNTSRANQVASTGPGSNSNSLGGLLKGVMNMNATASGSDSYKGSGDTENTNNFTGRIAASVINVLPNGNLMVAGERSIAFNSGLTTMRFSGIVNPQDIKSGNVVASGDIVDARLEAVGKGDVNDAAGRSWLQRILTKGLTVW